MTDVTLTDTEEAKPSGKKGFVLSVLLALAGAAGGYFATTSGLIPLGKKSTPTEIASPESEAKPAALPDVAYVDLPPIILSVNAGSSRHLKFHAQLEVNADYKSDVEKVLPRVVDVLNTYLRAVETSDLEQAQALTRIRGHLLRRIEIVVGEGRVRDVLVMEFVLN